MRRITIDLKDRINEIGERLSAIEVEAKGVDPDSAAFRELEETYEELQSSKREIESDIEAFGGSEFTIKKFKGGDDALVTDLVLADTIQDNLDDPRAKFGARRIRTVEVGVVESPPETPDNPRRFSVPTLGFLYDCIDELNRYGEVGLDDFSLSDAISKRGET